MNDYIPDDTDLSLLDRTDFQTVDRTSPDAVNEFVSDVEKLEDQTVHLSRNPYVRVGAVLGLTFFALGFGLMFSLGSRHQEQSVVPEEPEASALTLELTPDADSGNLSAAETAEVDALRSELALLQQQMALAEVDRDDDQLLVEAQRRRLETGSVASPSSPVASAPAAGRPAAAASPVATPVRSTLAPAPAVRIPPSPAAPVVRPASPAVLRSAPVSPPPASRSADYEAPDPHQAWYEASNSGVFGSMPVVQKVSEPVATETIDDSPYQLKTASFTEPQSAYESVKSVPGLIEPDTIPMGQSADAVVATPIVWLNQNDQFLIELQEDILNNRGEVAIPAGAAVVVQPVSVDASSGYAALAAVGLLIDNQLIPIDYTTVAIRGESGDPLIAERYGNPGSEIAANDLELFAIGALGRIGDVLTRPDNQSISTGAFGGSVNTEYGDRNIVGAILQGGAEQIADRMSDRNESRLSELRSRAQIYYLPEGRRVQFYINAGFLL